MFYTVLVQASLPWDSPGKNTGVSCHSLLQGIFQTQGSNLGVPYCRQILYHLNCQGSPIPCGEWEFSLQTSQITSERNKWDRNLLGIAAAREGGEAKGEALPLEETTLRHLCTERLTFRGLPWWSRGSESVFQCQG